MARGKDGTRLRDGMRGSRTSHAHSNIERSSNANSAPFLNANIPSVQKTVNGIGSQQPNHNVVVVSDTQENHSSTQDTSTIDGRLRITVVNRVLEPSSKCARIITKKFKEKVDFEGYTWKTVTQSIRDFYFEEFRKHFIWDSSLETQVKEAWVLKATQLYNDFLRDIRDASTKPEYLSEEEYKHWKAIWNKPTFKKQLEINYKNRCNVAGPSCHTEESTSNVEHRKKLDKMLTLKQHASFIKSGSTNSRPTPVDELTLYIEAVGGEKKRRAYDLGSQASSYYGCSNSNINNLTATSPAVQNNENLQNELISLRNQLQIQQERHRQELQETRQEMSELRRMLQLFLSQNQAPS